MIGLWRALLLCCACLGLTIVASAQVPAPTASQNVGIRMDAESSTVNRGHTVSVAFVMTPKPGWHDYWINPGDAGGPLTVEWSLPPGMSALPLQFPVPEPLLIAGFMNHVYKTPHAILADVKLDSAVAIGTLLPIRAKARWYACSDTLCVPEEADLSLQLTVANAASQPADRFDAWRAALPSPLDTPGRFSVSGNSLSLAVPLPASATIGPVHFFAKTENALRYAAPQTARRVGDWLVIEAARDKSEPTSIEGLLRIGDHQGLMVRAVPGAVPAGGAEIPVFSEQKNAVPLPPLPLLFLGALLGGLLLNLMPCVFPILGLKAMALAKAGGDEAAARRDSLAYSAGVILSCLALGATMLALRAGGQQVGWAFQLQEPAVVLALFLLMGVVTANMAGLFELGSIGGHVQTSHWPAGLRSFATGVLSALVATPCTGPFMAAAMGVALLLPSGIALLLFGCLGLGLSLPFLALAYIPVLRRRLPRPGPWLGIFRKVMAIPMALTALALGWLLWRMTGLNGLGIGIAAMLILVLALTLRPRATPLPLIPALAVFAGIAVVGAWALPNPAAVTKPAESTAIVPHIVFSQATLDQMRTNRTPVFLNFTADWCITCKVNEANAIQTVTTAKLFRDHDVVLMEGDFTRRDPAIARFLAQNGRSGVPFYLYYAPGQEPQILPQLLSEGLLAATVRKNVE